METIIVLQNNQYPSLNTYIRKHWAVRDKMLKNMQLIIRSQTTNKHLGRVSITVQRYACKLFDWDNFCGGFKVSGDALRYQKVIVDDKPEIIVRFIPEQYRVSHKKDERVLIKIVDLLPS